METPDLHASPGHVDADAIRLRRILDRAGVDRLEHLNEADLMALAVKLDDSDHDFLLRLRAGQSHGGGISRPGLL